jgi:hypothetical protein
MQSPPPRHVTLVLCAPDGRVRGALAPFEVVVPWWQEVGPVVDGARRHHGIEVTVLRLLESQPRERCAGGPVTYLAEVDDGVDPPTTPWTGADPTLDEPLRAPWARPGGPAADVAWADEELARRGTPRCGPAQQVRSWNLSSLWRLPLADGAAWLKIVPPFFAHEGTILGLLQPGDVPPLLAASGPRVLLGEVPGEDQYGAGTSALLEMVAMLVRLQVQWSARVGDLLVAGLPDWRGDRLTALVGELVVRRSPELDAATRARLDVLLGGLPERWDEVAACGLPDTLVHGDFHPGNARGSVGRLVLLDWGDSGVGHPMLDRAAFLEPVPEDVRPALRAAWAAHWQRAVPGSEPERAAELLAPVAALRQALIYQVFLDGIEPSERIYHERDPAVWLTRAAQLSEAPR